ncbi:MAG TPA: hypothetical protein VMM60_14855 [Ilumatobacter sp.]|nr:hypothetical protein [Ilumatobacter sp.]
MIAHTVLVAHQGGWDEFLLVLGPIVVIAAALALAKRRVDAQAASDAANGTASRTPRDVSNRELP